jgi:hypothetical protein
MPDAEGKTLVVTLGSWLALAPILEEAFGNEDEIRVCIEALRTVTANLDGLRLDTIPWQDGIVASAEE